MRRNIYVKTMGEIKLYINTFNCQNFKLKIAEKM